jgi:hypothetical protein
MHKSTITAVLLLALVGTISAQSMLPFTPLSENRVHFVTVTSSFKLNIYQNVFTILKCAPVLTINYTPKENTYLGYYTVEWTLGGSNVFYNKIDVGQYLLMGQSYNLAEKITTFNCQYGGHDELSYQPGRYSFVITMWDNNQRQEIIGKVAVSDQLNCVTMDNGCWAYTACDYYSTTCKSNSLEVEGEEVKQ